MRVPTYVTLPATVFLGALVGALEADPANALLSRATAIPALVGPSSRAWRPSCTSINRRPLRCPRPR